MMQPNDIPDAIARMRQHHAATHRDLQAVRATAGDQAAQEQAGASAATSVAFIADAVGRPDLARALVDNLRVRLAGSPPPKPVALSPCTDDPDGLGTRMGNDVSTMLHSVHWLLGEQRHAYAVGAAEGVMHAAIGFLFAIGEGDRAREVAEQAHKRAEQLTVLRDAPTTGGQQ